MLCSKCVSSEYVLIESPLVLTVSSYFYDETVRCSNIRVKGLTSNAFVINMHFKWFTYLYFKELNCFHTCLTLFGKTFERGIHFFSLHDDFYMMSL